MHVPAGEQSTSIHSNTDDDGTRLFDWPGGRQVRLEKVRVGESGALTDLRYRVAA